MNKFKFCLKSNIWLYSAIAFFPVICLIVFKIFNFFCFSTSPDDSYYIIFTSIIISIFSYQYVKIFIDSGISRKTIFRAYCLLNFCCALISTLIATLITFFMPSEYYSPENSFGIINLFISEKTKIIPKNPELIFRYAITYFLLFLSM